MKRYTIEMVRKKAIVTVVADDVEEAKKAALDKVPFKPQHIIIKEIEDAWTD